MTPPSFHRLVDDYLRVRRGLGFDLEWTEWKLRDFATYADRIGHSGAVTIELAVEWAQSSRSSNPAQAVRRLAAMRQFARHRALFDPATEVPPVGLLGRIPRRPPPHERSPRLQRHAVEKTFAGIRQRLGWAGHGRTRQPRIHDLRHTYRGQKLPLATTLCPCRSPHNQSRPDKSLKASSTAWDELCKPNPIPRIRRPS